MKMIGGTLVVVIAVIIGIAMCSNSHAQVLNQPPAPGVFGGSSSSSSSSSSSTMVPVPGNTGATSNSQSKSERCIRDAFGNYTCTESGTRIITDGNGNINIIPYRR